MLLKIIKSVNESISNHQVPNLPFVESNLILKKIALQV